MLPYFLDALTEAVTLDAVLMCGACVALAYLLTVGVALVFGDFDAPHRALWVLYVVACAWLLVTSAYLVLGPVRL